MSIDVGAGGDEIIGGYRVARTLLRGQSCDILEVVQESSSRRFALKQLRESNAMNSDERRLFAFEAKLGMELSHPNLIRVFEYVSKGQPYFVMEYFPSNHLRMNIAQKERFPLGPARTRRVIDQIARALGFMHSKGWVHRDVKPENILVNKNGDARLIDYALALRPTSGFMKMLGSKPPCQGTPSYMSPEQILRRPVAISADIYSFGVICYELAVGRQPFRANSQQELLQKHIRDQPASPIVYNKDVTPEYADLVLSMIAKEPAKRPPTLEDFLFKFRKVRIFKDDPSPLAEPAAL